MRVLAVSLFAVAAVAVLPSRLPERNAAQELARAAQTFAASLTDAQRPAALLPFPAEQRRAFHFVPDVYPGVRLGDLDLRARRAAHDLLRCALGHAGYLSATAVMALDDLLRALEEVGGRKAPHRDAERYFFALFGDPAAAQPWGLRAQGHHLSVNFTIDPARGVVSVTPLFLGTNPHEVRSGAKAGSRVLGDLEDAAFALLGSLREAQLARAKLPGDVPADILLGPAAADDALGAPVGLPGSDLDAAQAALLETLLRAVTERVRDDLAADQLARIDRAALHFAWCGALAPGAPHYFRLHAGEFVFEYDNIQNGANHVHTIWRSPGRDFGRDWLRAHYQAEHTVPAKR